MLKIMLMVHYVVLFLLCFLDMFHLPMIILLCLANCTVLFLTFLQEFDGGMESRTTSIQEGEDDKDINTSDTYTLKSESSSTWTSFPSRIPETVCTKNDATVTYGVLFKRSLYGWKHNFVTFPMPLD